MIFDVFQVLFYSIAVCTVLGNITPRAGYWSLYAYILVVIIIGSIFHIEDSQCGILYKGLQLNGGLDWLFTHILLKICWRQISRIEIGHHSTSLLKYD